MKSLLIFITLIALYPTLSLANSRYMPHKVQIEIVADDGRVFPFHNFHQVETGNMHRAYLEAVYGENYGIRVRNLTGQRIGLVITVDGRNIVSGQKSNLQPTERMYILSPYQQASYDGWRTSNSKINRFFFTDAGDSYAGAWGDYSAMGVIAVAVYPEKQQYFPRPHIEKKSQLHRRRIDAPAESSARADKGEAKLTSEIDESQPGTGFGNEQYSHARVVQFEPVSMPSSKYYFKYEWRTTLCNRGVIQCDRPYDNRFWPSNEELYGYAPYPPGY